MSNSGGRSMVTRVGLGMGKARARRALSSVPSDSLPSVLKPNAAVRRLVREQRGHHELPVMRVHASDEMWAWSMLNCANARVGQFAYYRSGMAIAQTIRDIVALQQLGPGPQILDFACGYGRSLRFTAADFGPDKVSGAEILPDAVTFVGTRLGCRAYQSARYPEHLDIGQKFDLIFVSSLFTHLPKQTFVPWITALYTLLTERGLLVISVHDETLLPPGEELDPDGFYFQSTTEVAALDVNDYGATVLNETYMSGAILAATGSEAFRRIPQSLVFQQDLYLIPAPGISVFADRLSKGVQGCVDSCNYVEQHLLISGWAAIPNEDDVVTRLEVRLDGQLLGTVSTGMARPDVASVMNMGGEVDYEQAGWSLDVNLPKAPTASANILVTAYTERGRRDVIWSTRLVDVTAGISLKGARGYRPTMQLPAARVTESKSRRTIYAIRSWLRRRRS